MKNRTVNKGVSLVIIASMEGSRERVFQAEEKQMSRSQVSCFFLRVLGLTIEGFINKNMKSRPPRQLAFGIDGPYSDCYTHSFFCFTL